MLLHYSLPLASLSLLPALVSSYQIHQSCVDKGIAGTVRDGMTSAFEMADSAMRHLDQSQYDRDTADLVRRLFLPKEGQDVNDKDKMLKVRRIFESIIRYYRTEIDTTGSPTASDIVRFLFSCCNRNKLLRVFFLTREIQIIYCDDSRYVYEGERDKLQRKLFSR
jgi:hypothetical protein